MIHVSQSYNIDPYFRAYAVADTNVESLGELCVHISSSHYTYMSISEAVQLANSINAGISLAVEARIKRRERAAGFADSEVSE